MNKENIAVVTDSCADIPKEIVEKLGIIVVPLNVIFGEEVLKDGIDITSKEFYKRLDESKKLPSSSQPTPDEFYEVYQDLLETYDRVISIHLSEKLSGTINSARAAAKDFGEKVFAFDSQSISVGVGLQVEAAVEVIKKGLPFEEIKDYLDKLRKSTHVMFTLDTLEYLHKGGRIGKAESLLGSLLNIKPIIIVRDGLYHAFGKTRSQKKAIKKISSHLQSISKGKTVKRLAVAHGMAYEAMELLKSDLEKAFNIKASIVTEVGPVIGVHTGPGTIGTAITFE
ncbi:MAG: DegV family protein [Clostridia bacterium]